MIWQNKKLIIAIYKKILTRTKKKFSFDFCFLYCFRYFMIFIFLSSQIIHQQLDNFEIKPGKCLKINVSVPNLRLFVGNIPKSKGKEEILDEFGKLTGKWNEKNVVVDPTLFLSTKKKHSKNTQNHILREKLFRWAFMFLIAFWFLTQIFYWNVYVKTFTNDQKKNVLNPLKWKISCRVVLKVVKLQKGLSVGLSSHLIFLRSSLTAFDCLTSSGHTIFNKTKGFFSFIDKRYHISKFHDHLVLFSSWCAKNNAKFFFTFVRCATEFFRYVLL